MAKRTIYSNHLDSGFGAVPVSIGGTGARTKEKACENLHVVSKDQVDQPEGIAVLSESGFIQNKNLPQYLNDARLPILQGLKELYYGDTDGYVRIANYDVFTSYELDLTHCQGVTCHFQGSDIIMSLDGTSFGDRSLSVNGVKFEFTTYSYEVYIPEILNLDSELLYDRRYATVPLNEDGTVTFEISSFEEDSGAATLHYTEWQVALDIDFKTIVQQSSAVENNEQWTVLGFVADNHYFLRARHVSTDNIMSQWTPVCEFTVNTLSAIARPVLFGPQSGQSDVSRYNTGYWLTPMKTVNFSGATVLAVDWELALDKDFKNLVASSYGDQNNILSWFPNIILDPLTMYYVRARQRASMVASNYSPYSPWSKASCFTTTADTSGIVTPTFEESYYSIDGVPNAVQFVLSEFATVDYEDDLISVIFDVSQDASFTSALRAIFTPDAAPPTFAVVPQETDKLYYVRAKYVGNNRTSSWSAVFAFKVSRKLAESANYTSAAYSVTLTF